jgi:hypothetical protein
VNGFLDLDTGLVMGDVPPLLRSRLYRLPPQGGGTPFQESLISFLVRTSRAHSVSPRRLIRQVFGGVDPEIGKVVRDSFFSRYAGTMNGLNRYAELFVHAGEMLTGHDNLRGLTMLPWNAVLPHNGQGLLARHPRWCPECLMQQWQQDQETFFPLAWYLDAVYVCPAHQRRLEDRCPYCRRQQPFIPSYPDLARCEYCKRPFVLLPTGDAPDCHLIDPVDMWVAQAIDAMLQRHVDPEFLPHLPNFYLFINGLVDRLAGGNRAAFCKALGLQPRALNGWLSKGQRPSMTQLLTVCYRVKAMPSDIFGQSTSLADLSLIVVPAPKLKHRRQCPRLPLTRRQEIAQQLRIRLAVDDERPVSVIAEELGIPARYLRYWFPEISSRLTGRNKSAIQAQSAAHQVAQCCRVRQVVWSLAARGVYPSCRRVNAILRRDGMCLLQPKLQQAYIEAVGEMKKFG